LNIIYKTKKKKSPGKEVQIFMNEKLRHESMKGYVQHHTHKNGSEEGIEPSFPVEFLITGS